MKESADAKARRETDAKRLQSGALPLGVVERLGALASSGQFTASLSPGELLLLRETGFEPLGQVMGASTYKTMAPTNSFKSGELQFLTTALGAVQDLALTRLRQELELLGATGMIGVQIRRTIERNPNEDGEVLTFQLVGTAVREIGARAPKTGFRAFLSALSGAEFSNLRAAGYRPVGLVLGNSAYYQLGRAPKATSMMDLARTSYERTECAEAISAARRHAMERMRQQASALQADGIVGVRIEIDRGLGGETGVMSDLFCRFFTMGTAVQRMGRPSADPQTTLEVL